MDRTGTAMMTGPHRLCVMHTLDPRGSKVGGIETHVRNVLANASDTISVLLVGVDEIGDAPLGVVQRLAFEGRPLDFLPVLRVAPGEVNGAARRLTRSVTLRFALGAIRHLGAIRRALGPGSATIDLHRTEFALIARLLGRPFIQMVHGDGSSTKADSLLARYQGLHRLNQRHALRHAGHVLCVSDGLLQAAAGAVPEASDKLMVMSASVDTRRFKPLPFRLADGVFRVVYAGRLEGVKDPGLMFETIRILGARPGVRLEFHYLGASDPTVFPEFAAIAGATIRHGQQDAAGVAQILARCHAGILTSHSEGMPCFLLEGLASGRPFGAISLPSYAGVIEPEAGSRLVPRGVSQQASAGALAAAFLEIWNDIRAGITDPDGVADAIAPFSVTRQLGRLFDLHLGLVRRERSPPERRRDTIVVGPLRIARKTTPDVIAMVDHAVAGGPRLRIAFCNAHSMLMAFDRPGYARILARLTLLNDGIGANLAVRVVAGRRFPENLNGTDLVPRLLRDAAAPLRLFLLGATPAVVAEAARRLAEAYPRHVVVGAQDGYFGPLGVAGVLDAVRAAKPDLMLVAMGNPHQEEFIARHDRDLACPVVMAVGGLFDFLAGAKPRAPRPVRALRCEWLFRLALEPRRLGRRYTLGVARFLWMIARLRAAKASQGRKLAAPASIGARAEAALRAARRPVPLTRPDTRRRRFGDRDPADGLAQAPAREG